MKALKTVAAAFSRDNLASSFSDAEKWLPHTRSHDERSRTDILTSGFKPYSRLPARLREQWHGELVTRYSGATVPDSHRVPGYPAATDNDSIAIAIQ